jgi:hypothetical protein
MDSIMFVARATRYSAENQITRINISNPTLNLRFVDGNLSLQNPSANFPFYTLSIHHLRSLKPDDAATPFEHSNELLEHRPRLVVNALRITTPLHNRG